MASPGVKLKVPKKQLKTVEVPFSKEEITIVTTHQGKTANYIQTILGLEGYYRAIKDIKAEVSKLNNSTTQTILTSIPLKSTLRNKLPKKLSESIKSKTPTTIITIPPQLELPTTIPSVDQNPAITQQLDTTSTVSPPSTPTVSPPSTPTVSPTSTPTVSPTSKSSLNMNKRSLEIVEEDFCSSTSISQLYKSNSYSINIEEDIPSDINVAPRISKTEDGSSISLEPEYSFVNAAHLKIEIPLVLKLNDFVLIIFKEPTWGWYIKGAEIVNDGFELLFTYHAKLPSRDQLKKIVGKSADIWSLRYTFGPETFKLVGLGGEKYHKIERSNPILDSLQKCVVYKVSKQEVATFKTIKKMK